MFLQQVETLEQRARLLRKHGDVVHRQKIALGVKAFVDRPRLERSARKQLPGDILLQDRIDLHDPARIDVIALHQLFAGALAAGRSVYGLVAKRFGHLRLIVEQETVFAPSSRQVQARAQ